MATVRYFVKNVDEAVAFYTSALGFVLKQQFGPAMAIVDVERSDAVARRPRRLGLAADA